MRKILLIIEDDFEVMGNGLGNVAYHQYLPANFLMNLCEEIGIRVSFMVDLAHILELKKISKKHPDLNLQVSLWEETVQQMVQRGFDVQLHLHPQWLNAVYKKPFFYLSDNWNIGRYSLEDQRFLIVKSIEYLTQLISPVKPDYKVHTFKAGSWGMQPSENLLSIFNTYGFEIICGLRKDMHIPDAGIDYRNLEEPTFPYYPNFHDIQKIGTQNSLIVIPLAFYAPDIVSLSKLIFRLFMGRRSKKRNYHEFYNRPIPKEISSLNGINNKKIVKLGLRPYLTHLKMSNEPFSYLKKSFDKVHHRVIQLEGDVIPVIIESHTKHYMGNYANIVQFLKYIADQYHETVEFITFSDYVSRYKKKSKIMSNENIQ